MFSFSLVTATLAISALSASARVLPRHRAIAAREVTVPSTYDQNYLEDYFTYHARYLALGCQYNHGNDFFDACCHPLLKNETLSDREARCTPDPTVLSSVSASLEGVTSTDSTPSSTADATTPTVTAAATTTPVIAQNVAAPSSSSQDAPSSSADTESSSSDASTPTSSSASASSTSSVQTGGFGTFFYQNGVAGACGTVHSDSDYVFAMDSAIYSQSICGKSVTITNTANGKSVTGVVADECPTCNNANSIDMSLAAFQAIGALSTGLLDITWVWA
ncbi:hypothetical protein GYMLUDRAFT_72655 [Collybiopsis luxurians FD-317 M1]|jgi:hypothetical protein|uniref:Barwin domain-containing protein n=1 Tax=Collybiopsis luxurians FD-317 M1 TaxID=944289 RepID=A0A0D0C2S8_9AGAR|nr:hypothetical protein GYMLUDRAFT_72655 [Collybiopsis luxurians FD-317 M1]